MNQDTVMLVHKQCETITCVDIWLLVGRIYPLPHSSLRAKSMTLSKDDRRCIIAHTMHHHRLYFIYSQIDAGDGI